MPDSPDTGPPVAVAGASGFVGSHLRESLKNKYSWRALTRSHSVVSAADSNSTSWQQCDLFSLPRVEEALQGCRAGIYLVHSMLPSSRLVQGHFRDMDLLLADNFARAAKSCGLDHIVYLGGLVPADPKHLSPHLASRLEVEDVLRQSGLAVTVLRAGLIIGPGGSSTRMLLNLVRRLPVMILPKWTRCRTGSIDIRDVSRAFDAVLRDEQFRGGTYDLATHRAMTYERMILGAGEILGRRPLVCRVPVNFIKLSHLWVRCFSSVPSSLVGPLMESLTYDLDPRPNALLSLLDTSAVGFEQSIRDSVDPKSRPLENPRKRIIQKDNQTMKSESRVRSIQRMPLPPGWDAPRVADEYREWLSKTFLTTLFVEQQDDGSLCFVWRIPRIVLLKLVPTPFSSNTNRRRAFYISGGVLARTVDPPGRFEFRVFPENNCLIAAIHGFAPSLPWYLYEFSQAIIHLVVMRSFARHLKKEQEQIRSGEATGSS